MESINDLFREHGCDNHELRKAVMRYLRKALDCGTNVELRVQKALSQRDDAIYKLKRFKEAKNWVKPVKNEE